MQLRRLFRSQSGDTIVEVLVCIVIISFMLVGAFVTVRKNLAAERSAQEHDDATQIVQSQQEALRLATVVTSITNDPDMATGKSFFCVDNNPTTGGPAVVKMTPLPGAQITSSTALPSTSADYGTGSANAPCAVDNGGAVYHVGAPGQEYYLADYYDSADQSFKVIVRWDQLGGGTSTSTSAYRVHSNTVVGIGSSSSIVGAPVPVEKPSVSVDKTSYHIGDPVVVTYYSTVAPLGNCTISGTWGTGSKAVTTAHQSDTRAGDTSAIGTITYTISCNYPDGTTNSSTAHADVTGINLADCKDAVGGTHTQTYTIPTVPDGSVMEIQAVGGSGGATQFFGSGNYTFENYTSGGGANGYFTVGVGSGYNFHPGDVIAICVGQGGMNGLYPQSAPAGGHINGATGSVGGGGAGGASNGGNTSGYAMSGAAGGGATSVVDSNGNLLLVAGGGGGGGGFDPAFYSGTAPKETAGGSGLAAQTGQGGGGFGYPGTNYAGGIGGLMPSGFDGQPGHNGLPGNGTQGGNGGDGTGVDPQSVGCGASVYQTNDAGGGGGGAGGGYDGGNAGGGGGGGGGAGQVNTPSGSSCFDQNSDGGGGGGNGASWVTLIGAGSGSGSPAPNPGPSQTACGGGGSYSGGIPCLDHMPDGTVMISFTNGASSITYFTYK